MRQFLSDDKGTVCIAAFGLPPNSLQHVQLRALQGCLELLVALKAQGIDATIGVTTDELYVGNVGNASRCEYCIIGDAVNMAARLMGAASKMKQDAFCDEATMSACKATVDFQSYEPIRVEGRKQPLPVWRPLRKVRHSVSLLWSPSCVPCTETVLSARWLLLSIYPPASPSFL